MKKFLLIMLGALLSLPTMAQEFLYEYEGQTLIYTIIDEEAKTCKTGRNNYVFGDLVIPAEVTDGESVYRVTEIGDWAFEYCTSLTSVTIPGSVNSIGGWAFYGCSSLTSVTIPEGVISIGDCAFYQCSSLTSITIPGSVNSIGRWAFYGCSSLTSVTIPEGVTSIEAFTFKYCIRMTSIIIPGSVTFIGDEAFRFCSSLTSVTIPEGVAAIGIYAFYGCDRLTSITILGSVTFIGGWAFYGCTGLTSVYYAADEPVSGNYNIFSSEAYENATLYMTENGVILSKYKDPWKNFKNVKEYDFSGIDDVIADFDETAPYEIYNLNGVKVGDSTVALAPGLYIIRQGNAVKKITVK